MKALRKTGEPSFFFPATQSILRDASRALDTELPRPNVPATVQRQRRRPSLNRPPARGLALERGLSMKRWTARRTMMSVALLGMMSLTLHGCGSFGRGSSAQKDSDGDGIP